MVSISDVPGYVSEVDYDGDATSNFVEVAVPHLKDTSGYSLVIYNNDGSIAKTYESLGDVVSTAHGYDVYLLDNSSTGGFEALSSDMAIAVVNSGGSVEQFISFGETVQATTGPAGGMVSRPIGESSVSLVTDDLGQTYYSTSSSTPGSLISAMPSGVPSASPSSRPSSEEYAEYIDYLGSYISELDYEGGATSNFVEVTVPKGTDTSGYFIVVYDQSGYVIGAYSLGEVVSTNLGQEV
jgi:hypothetical protein